MKQSSQKKTENGAFHGFPLPIERTQRDTNQYITFTHNFESIKQVVLLATHNFLEEQLETDETTLLAKLFNSMGMARYLERNTKQEFLETYGNENVEKLMKVAMPELALGSIVSEWTGWSFSQCLCKVYFFILSIFLLHFKHIHVSVFLSYETR